MSFQMYAQRKALLDSQASDIKIMQHKFDQMICDDNLNEIERQMAITKRKLEKLRAKEQVNRKLTSDAVVHDQLVVEILAFNKGPEILLRDCKTKVDVKPVKRALALEMQSGYAYEFTFKVLHGHMYDVMILQNGRVKDAKGIVSVNSIKYVSM